MSVVSPIVRGDGTTTGVLSPRSPELAAAFAAFNESSLLLQHSYAQLERRVSVLTEALAEARSERVAQLAEKERLANRLSGLLAALPGAVVVLDATGRIQDCNEGAIALFGNDLPGTDWCSALSRIDARADHGGELVLRDGRQLNISIRPLAGDEGRVMLLTDVTQIRDLQNAVQRQERLSAMGEMMARLAHQTRTPLATAILYASQMRRTLEDERSLTCAERILTHLRQMEHLLDDMLCFARGGRGGGTLIAVRQLLQGALDELPAHVTHHVRVHAPAQDVFVRGNRRAIASALGNLLQNALAFGQAPRVELRVDRTANDTIALSVSDDGPGVDPHLADRIFDPFFTTRSNGTGLGLAVVRSVAQAHGGNAYLLPRSTERACDGDGPGGSTFVIELPDAAAHGAGEPPGGLEGAADAAAAPSVPSRPSNLSR